MDPPLRNTRNRRSKKVGASWTARTRRLRAFLNSVSDHDDNIGSTQHLHTSRHRDEQTEPNVTNFDARASRSPVNEREQAPTNGARDPPQSIHEPDHTAAVIDAHAITAPPHLDLIPPPLCSHDSAHNNSHAADAVQLEPASRSDDEALRSSVLFTPSVSPAGGLFSVLGDIQDAFQEVRSDYLH